VSGALEPRRRRLALLASLVALPALVGLFRARGQQGEPPGPGDAAADAPGTGPAPADPPHENEADEPTGLTRLRFYTVVVSVVVVVILPTLFYIALSWRPSSSDQRAVPALKVVAYYPPGAAWSYMWTRYDPERIASDLQRAHALGFDTVRIFVQPATFGYPNPSARMQQRLRDVVAAAASARMKVGLSLFDRFEDYPDHDGSATWLRAMLGPYAHDPRIAFVELHNEIDPSNPKARSWYGAMMRVARRTHVEAPLLASVPGRVGVSGLAQLAKSLGTDQPDEYSLHYYLDPAYLVTTIERAQRAVAPVPLVLGEVGYSTAASNRATSGAPQTRWAQEAEQSLVLRAAFDATRRLALPPAGIWTLYDYRPGAFPADVAPHNRTEQSTFGLLRSDGSPKPVVADVEDYLKRNAISTDINADFSRGGPSSTGAQPADWREFDGTGGTLGWDPNVGHDAPGSVRMTRTRGSAIRVPSYFQKIWSIEIRPHESFSVSAWSEGTNVSGDDRIAVAWFDANGRYLGQKESPRLPAGSSGWTKLVVHARPPRNAVAIEVHLKSSHEAGTVWFDDVVIE
jgi:hypothetical protein